MSSTRTNFSQYIKTNKLIVGALILILMVSFGSMYAYGSQKSKSANRQASSCEAANCVSLNKEAASPETLTVKTDDFVQFNSTDGKKHNISLVHSGAQHDDESHYDSGDFAGDEAWKVQFKKDGAYSFQDKYNEKINVSVVVYTPGKDYKVE